MYKIIGANQVEYGPITAEQVRQWILEGRVNGQTAAQAVGETTWKPISSFPEFASSFGGGAVPPSSSPSTPPPLGRAAVSVTPEGGRARALGEISGPAIGLMITGILNIVLSFVGMLITLVGGRSNGLDQLEALHLPRQNQEFLRAIKMLDSGPLDIIQNVVAIALGIIILYGALKMKKLESHGLSIAASILAVVPCCTPCCCIGIPIGIWALIVLNKPEVKSHFT